MKREYTKETKGLIETQMDRPCSFPDGLIHHIISFMDAKYAVQTCILSKRWVNLWTYLPVLNFDSKFFTRVDNFKCFIPHVLDYCETSNILALSICMRKSTLEKPLFDKIISFAVSHGIQGLDLSFHSSEGVLQSAFRCQSLRVLKLEGFLRNHCLPNSIYLASLRTLILCRVALDGKNHCFDFFSSCVNLQDLVLDKPFVIFSNVFNISALVLVNLTMSHVAFFIARDHDNIDYASIEKTEGSDYCSQIDLLQLYMLQAIVAIHG